MKKMTAALDFLRDVETTRQAPDYSQDLLHFKDIREAVYRYPSVCMVLPFNPKMVCKSILTGQLKTAFLKVEKELLRLYPFDVCDLLLFKLKAIIGNVNFNTHKSSLAIFVSPVFEKVYYLNMAVEESIWVDQSFEMRALLQAKKQDKHYLLLTLDNGSSQVFLGNRFSLTRILCNSIQLHNPAKPVHRNSSKVSFFDRTDQTLHHLVNAYQLPLFVMAKQSMLAAFKKHTKHASAIIEYIPSKKPAGTPQRLKKMMEPSVKDWESVCQKNLQNKLNEAAAKNELVAGITEVWRVAMNGRGKLLLVEKNYDGRLQRFSMETGACHQTQPYHSFSCKKNAMDALIEKLLVTDGEVVIVEDGWLKDYGHIALISL